MDDERRVSMQHTRASGLTAIDEELFAAVVLGRSNATIARASQRSVGTIAKQVARMLRKHGVTTRRELMSLVQDYRGSKVAGDSSGSLNASPSLSEREREVLQRVGDGQSNKQIAAALGVTQSTIGVILYRARAKLRSRRRAEHALLA